MKGIAGIGSFTPKNARDQHNWQRLHKFCQAEPQAFGRNPSTGHVTGSAFVLSPDRSAVLLTHHAKLKRWLQLGGHCDGIRDVPFVALKEAYEESGLSRIESLGRQVFDVDIHEIPAHGGDPVHLHYDVRYLFQATDWSYHASRESLDLAWVPVADLPQYTAAQSVLILLEKLPHWQEAAEPETAPRTD